MEQKSKEYKRYWWGKNPNVKKAVEEYLLYIEENQRPTQKELALKYGITTQSIRLNLRQLRENGLIKTSTNHKTTSKNKGIIYKCAVCRERLGVQEHHLTYNPEIKIDVCIPCHKLIHNHGIGRPKDNVNNDSRKRLKDVLRKLNVRLDLPPHGTKEYIRIYMRLYRFQESKTRRFGECKAEDLLAFANRLGITTIESGNS